MKFLLKIPSKIYGAIVERRNRRFDRDAKLAKRLDALTISVGNITVGGTGKTPLVALIAKILAENGLRPCVLTRGYKRRNEAVRVVVSDGENILADARTAGDEPLELALKLRGIAAVVADKNRFQAGIFARENLSCNAFVLDDGFQHRKVFRHLDILLIDATKPFGNGAVLPYGILREPLENLSRADIFVITRADLVEEEVLYAIKKTIKKFAGDDKPIFHAVNKISQIIDIEELNNATHATNSLQNEKYFAFCGLGNPENFYTLLRKNNLPVAGTKSFRDHHQYDSEDLTELTEKARQANADALLTTYKDAVKLLNFKKSFPLKICVTETFIGNHTEFSKLIKQFKM